VFCNDVIFPLTELFNAICAARVALIPLIDVLFALINVSCDANVLFVDVTRLVIFAALVLIEDR
jgi:hypothetical protein